jgi:hypothetical protein
VLPKLEEETVKRVIGILLALTLGACSHVLSGTHPEADTSTTRMSRNGTFVVSYEPSIAPVPKRRIHAWTVEVRTRDGHPVDGATMTVGGGMPDHGHGLPTQPAVTQALGDGRYVVDGMKFNMGGYWVVDFGITAAEGSDDVRFELNL